MPREAKTKAVATAFLATEKGDPSKECHEDDTPSLVHKNEDDDGGDRSGDFETTVGSSSEVLFCGVLLSSLERLVSPTASSVLTSA